MKTETAIGAAMASKGLLARNVKLQLALAEFQNNGGEYGVALAMLNAAYGKGSEGRVRLADGLATNADASPNNGDGAGLGSSAEKAGPILPSPSSPQRSAGRKVVADSSVIGMPVAAPKKPGHAKRGAAAIAAVQATVSKSLFDTLTLPDGRRLREVRWSECPSLAARYRKLSRIFMAIHNAGVPADADATIDAIVNDERLNEIVSAVELVNDVH